MQHTTAMTNRRRFAAVDFTAIAGRLDKPAGYGHDDGHG
jgi:hypothetical protein